MDTADQSGDREAGRWRQVGSVSAITSKWLSVDCNTYVTPAGRVDDYYVLTRNDFVLVIAVDDDCVLMVRQYRPATDRFYLALPAGYVEPGEDELSAARRELWEETGAHATDWEQVGELHPLPGYVHSAAHVFRCRIDGFGAKPSVRGDDTEGIEAVRLRRQDVLRGIKNGEIIEMQTVSAILLAQLKGNL